MSHRITILLAVLLGLGVCLPARAGLERLHDDVRILRLDSSGMELVLEPRWDIVPAPSGSLVRAAHCSDPDLPRRRLRVALPPGAAPRVQVEEASTRSCAGPLAGSGLEGANPQPVLQWQRVPLGDLDVLEMTLELVRDGGASASLVGALRLRVDFGVESGPGFTSRLTQTELQAGLLNPLQAARWATRPRLAARDGEGAWDGHSWVRIPIDEEGLYQISATQLSSWGLDPATLDPGTIKLYGFGGKMIDESPAAARNNEFRPREIPIIREHDGDGRFESGERLVFHGTGTSTLTPLSTGSMGVQDHFYSDTNVYWLLVGGVLPGRSMDAIADPSGATPFPLSAVRWRGLLNQHKGYGESSARACFGDVFRQGTRAVYAFDAPLSGATTLRLEYDFYPDLLMSQDQLALEANGQALTLGFPHSTQLEGSVSLAGNRLEIAVERLTDTGLPILLNWLMPSFDAPARFVDGRVAYELPAVPGTYQVQLQDVPASFWLVDVTDYDSLRVTRNATVVDRVKALSSGAGRARRYFGAAESALRTPTGASLASMPDLKSLAGSSRLVVIAPRVFHDAAQEIVAVRSAAGVPARLVDLEDIYDEFNAGVPDPGALRNFLRHEWLNAADPAEHVLLVGNGHYDWRGLVEGGMPARMPAWYLYSTSTSDADPMIDDWFVQLESSSRLDMALGRLPANSVDDVRAYAAKLAAYGTIASAGAWRNRLLFVADDEHGENNEVTGFEMTHSQDTEELIQTHVPAAFETQRLYSFEYPSVYNPAVRVMEKPLAEARLVEALNEGVGLVNFLGHGNNTTWTHEYIFNAPRHFPLLQGNGKPAVFIAATCSWAEVDLPIGEAFPQQLVNMEEGGAIGVLAATRKTGGFSNLNFVDDLFTVFFSRDATSGRHLAMGEAVRLAKNEGYDSNRRKYVWLGDPSLQPAFPLGEGSLEAMSSGGVPSDTLFSHVLAGLDLATGDAGSVVPVASGQGVLRVRQAPVLRTHHYDPLTDGNIDLGIELDYESPGALLFSGAMDVEEGRAQARFVVPADVGASSRPAQLHFYYQGQTAVGDDGDGRVFAQPPLAINPAPGVDGQAPTLRLALNGPQWREEDWVAPNSSVVLFIHDSSGVNLTGEIGHRIEVEIDGGAPHDLSATFEYERGSWTSGEARLELPLLEPGRHRLRARAFDNFNNPGYAEAEFQLLGGGSAQLVELVNHPNPVGESTRFTFQLQGALNLEPEPVELQVYTVKGRRVARERLALSTQGGFCWTEEWRPRNDHGEALARGVYLYRLSLPLPEVVYSLLDEDGQYVVKRQAGARAEATGKLIVE